MVFCSMSLPISELLYYSHCTGHKPERRAITFKEQWCHRYTSKPHAGASVHIFTFIYTVEYTCHASAAWGHENMILCNRYLPK